MEKVWKPYLDIKLSKAQKFEFILDNVLWQIELSQINLEFS